MEDFEKLGVFYLGRQHDLSNRQTSPELLLYDSKDLTTHAVVVGMTGSGKTGLCINLLEEAALDRIPSIAIDPKGDLANLLLTFPKLSAAEFRPWIDESQAVRAGLTPDQFAAAEAEKWSRGLEQWGQSADRIARLRETVDMNVYTPGSSAGRPLTVLRSFAAPSSNVLSDVDALRERISASTSGLLGLLGIDADPIRSREHILISKILETAWSAGQDLDIARLIGEIQKPPFAQVGVMEVDQFFPPTDRMELAMTLNNLLASPTFAGWIQGEPLDVKRLMHTPDGKPCLSIMSIAHLPEPQRMFFVTILLNEVLAWMRSQPGTASLRAILYMDEVFGYFPPTANPPSKQPMLTLLKQARAHGLGVVLATQNPVDLDYKGLSNAGTWFLGRLQTERDKLRVLEGLEGASAQSGSNFDRSRMEAVLAGLGSRIFLMNNVHDTAPEIFETRWAMSYLRGPLTRQQIQSLTAKESENAAVPPDDESPPPVAESPPAMRPEELYANVDGPRLIPENVPQRYAPLNPSHPAGGRVIYRPLLWGSAMLHFSKSTARVDYWERRQFTVSASGTELPRDLWEAATVCEGDPKWLEQPEQVGSYAAVPEPMQQTRQFKQWEKEFKSYLYREQVLHVLKSSELKEYSKPGETEGDFRVRLEQVVSEKRDAALEKLREKYGTKRQSLEDKISSAKERIEREEEQYRQSRASSAVSVVATLLRAITGRRKVTATTIDRASTSMRSMGRTASQKGDVKRARENLAKLQKKLQQLEKKFADEIAAIDDKLNVGELEFDEIEVRPLKSDLNVESLGVLWMPIPVTHDSKPS